MAELIDGKIVAQKIHEEVSHKVDQYRKLHKIPGLAVILVGNDPGSQVYVNMKTKACRETGIHSITEKLSGDISENDLLERLSFFNQSTEFHGVLVQLPLPGHINESRIIESVDLQKDVDCFHPYNVGRLMAGNPIFEPATPAGIMELLARYRIDPGGKHVVVLGRSNIVGKPLSMMLVQKKLGANAIVTLVHTAAKNISQYTRRADILIAAMGKSELVTGDMVKTGVVVIDVGVNRIPADNEKGYRLVGDVNFADVSRKASAITPVPGGVGPMTIAMLLMNTLKAFEIQEGIH